MFSESVREFKFSQTQSFIGNSSSSDQHAPNTTFIASNGKFVKHPFMSDILLPTIFRS